MNGAIIGVFLVIIAYLVMMLAIGFFYSKGTMTPAISTLAEEN